MRGNAEFSSGACLGAPQDDETAEHEEQVYPEVAQASQMLHRRMPVYRLSRELWVDR